VQDPYTVLGVSRDASEDEINHYRFIFAANKFYQLCCDTNRAFPTELKTALKSGNTIASRLLDFDFLPVHLMFAE